MSQIPNTANWRFKPRKSKPANKSKRSNKKQNVDNFVEFSLKDCPPMSQEALKMQQESNSLYGTLGGSVYEIPPDRITTLAPVSYTFLYL